MSAEPMRSAIRVLSESSAVKSILHNKHANKIRVIYHDGSDNAQSVRNVIEMMNFYFEKLYNTPEAIEFINEDNADDAPEKRRYFIDTCTHKGEVFFRIDIHSDFIKKNSFYKASRELVDVELLCLQNAKNYIVKELGTHAMSQKSYVEFNYANINDPVLCKRYMLGFRNMPKPIQKHIDISLSRIHPDTELNSINSTISKISQIKPGTCLSVFYDNNIEFIERLLQSNAQKLFLTIDYNLIKNIGDVLQTQQYIYSCAEKVEPSIVLTNMNPENESRFKKEERIFKFSGRQTVEF